MGDATTTLAELAARRSLPSTASLQLTTYCNYRCVHCYQEHATAPRPGSSAIARELSLTEIERILGELAQSGILLLTLTGGEVFTRRDALEVIGIAHRLGFVLRLKTTGHFLDRTKADALAAARPLQVDLSLYGAISATHETITGVAGSWQRVVSATQLLVERGIKVTLTSPIMEVNAAEAGKMRDLAHDLGATWTSDPKIAPLVSGDLGPVSLRMRGNTLRRFYRGEFGGGVGEELGDLYSKADIASFRTLNDLSCGAGTNVVAISPIGELLPCNMMPLAAGDLRTRSFLEIWRESQLLNDLRDLRYSNISECNICALRPYCRRCHTIALAEHGSCAGPSLEACRHAVVVRDFLRDRGVIPGSETALPPTWDRVDLDGCHWRRPKGRSCRCG